MKKTNKGFSLVELIIVIAIMAILAGAIAPALIRYIDKSRKSNDVSSAKTIKTSIETVMSNETAYEYLTSAATGGSVTVTFTPGANAGGATAGIVVTGATSTDSGNALVELSKNIGEKIPKVKYKKDAATGDSTANHEFVAYISNKGTVAVGVKHDAGEYMLAPDVDENYQ